jgi:hypothetical protein
MGLEGLPFYYLRAINSVGKCYLHTVEVDSSILSSPIN